MKKLLCLSLIIISVLTIASCGNKSEEKNEPESTSPQPASAPAVVIPAGTELWAEQVQSTTEISRPTDWEEKDWNEIYRNINSEKIFNTIKDAVMKGELVAYNYFDTAQKYTSKEIDEMLNFTSVTEKFNEETGNLDQTKHEHHLSAKDIAAVKVKEKWVFDPKSYNMYKIVTDMGFFVNSYTSDSLVRGTRPLFYVKLGKTPNS